MVNLSKELADIERQIHDSQALLRTQPISTPGSNEKVRLGVMRSTPVQYLQA